MKLSLAAIIAVIAVRPGSALSWGFGCERDRALISLPASYDQAAKTAAAVQLAKAGVRLAWVL